MTSNNRIKLMTRVALYEENNVEKDKKIALANKNDYVGIHMIEGFISGSLAFIMIIGTLMGFVIMSNIDFLKNNIMLLLILGLIVYLVFIIIYLIVINKHYKIKYDNASKRINHYYADLCRIEKLYKLEEQQKKALKDKAELEGRLGRINE